ncbi:MAG TPA: GNAT family N-acetyltransferase [Steroidobacteraceae bacterium]|nr:GNAT family N-acetyltransferase [Steroidobacteraceae bacterium]
MAGHALDNPVWHSLTTQHAGLAITADGAARYPAAIVPFAAIGEPSPRAADQLASLVDDAESVFVVGVAPAPPPGWQLEPKKPVLQMVCKSRAPDIPGPPVRAMTDAEVPDMVALTELVFPGFFRARTLEMGRYCGIYDGARLAAMAGERMRLDGYQELSAVCTHPGYTGRGYAQRLLAILCNSAFDRGFTPFLHVYADNSRAIGVYRKMSFVDRTVLPFWALHQ